MRVRTYRGREDALTWLAIRNQVFAAQTAGARPWTEADFQREFLDKPWWRPEWMWFAEAQDPSTGEFLAVGAVAMKEVSPPKAGAVQWLAVLPEWRRRRVGRGLMAVLETAAGEAGIRTLTAETLSEWEAATRFYRSLGFRPNSGHFP